MYGSMCVYIKCKKRNVTLFCQENFVFFYDKREGTNDLSFPCEQNNTIWGTILFSFVDKPHPRYCHLKGLSHEIFTVIFWLDWIYLGLKGNRFWFLTFKDVSSILDSYFKY
jgi:hypothetical protein